MISAFRGLDFTAQHLRPGEDDRFAEVLAATPMVQGDLVLQTHLPTPIEAALTRDRQGNSKAVLFEDCDGRAVGCASLSLWNEHALKSVGLQAHAPDSRICYVGDLRFRADAPRAIWQGWRQAYRALLADLLHPAQGAPLVQGVVTSVLDQNVRATNAFLKGRSGINYVPLFKYTTFSIPAIACTPQEGPSEFAFRGDIQRQWKVNNTQLRSVFSLVDSTLETPADCRAVLAAAGTYGRQTLQHIFQIAFVGSQGQLFEDYLKTEQPHLFHWKTTSTLYAVSLLDVDERPALAFRGDPTARTIDPTQL